MNQLRDMVFQAAQLANNYSSNENNDSDLKQDGFLINNNNNNCHQEEKSLLFSSDDDHANFSISLCDSLFEINDGGLSISYEAPKREKKGLNNNNIQPEIPPNNKQKTDQKKNHLSKPRKSTSGSSGTLEQIIYKISDNHIPCFKEYNIPKNIEFNFQMVKPLI
jgi:hypothetical protein